VDERIVFDIYSHSLAVLHPPPSLNGANHKRRKTRSSQKRPEVARWPLLSLVSGSPSPRNCCRSTNGYVGIKLVAPTRGTNTQHRSFLPIPCSRERHCPRYLGNVYINLVPTRATATCCQIWPAISCRSDRKWRRHVSIHGDTGVPMTVLVFEFDTYSIIICLVMFCACSILCSVRRTTVQ
jgi:hypothetical protein